MCSAYGGNNGARCRRFHLLWDGALSSRDHISADERLGLCDAAVRGDHARQVCPFLYLWLYLDNGHVRPNSLAHSPADDLSSNRLAVYTGPTAYINALFSAERIVFTLVYFVSIVATLYASLFVRTLSLFPRFFSHSRRQRATFCASSLASFRSARSRGTLRATFPAASRRCGRSRRSARAARGRCCPSDRSSKAHVFSCYVFVYCILQCTGWLHRRPLGAGQRDARKRGIFGIGRDQYEEQREKGIKTTLCAV